MNIIQIIQLCQNNSFLYPVKTKIKFNKFYNNWKSMTFVNFREVSSWNFIWLWRADVVPPLQDISCSQVLQTASSLFPSLREKYFQIGARNDILRSDCLGEFEKTNWDYNLSDFLIKFKKNISKWSLDFHLISLK